MSEFKPIRTTSSNLSNVSVVDGQIILTTDTGACYIDFGSTRVQIGVAVNQGAGNSGKYLTVNSSGTVTNTAFPVASTSVVGGVKVDGTIATVNSSDVLQVNKNKLVLSTGTDSIALGRGATASDSYDIAIGRLASSDGVLSYSGATPAIAIGYQASATGHDSIAIGDEAVVNGNYSIQIGGGICNEDHSLYIGAGEGGNSKVYDLHTGKIENARLPYPTEYLAGAVQPDGTSITMTNDGVISAVDPLESLKVAANAGKYLTINSSGAVVATSLPVYAGEVE